MKQQIYLDYNASAPLHPDSLRIIRTIFESENGHGAYNASSVHHYGRQGRKFVEDARRQVANLINADTNQVIFNSGATEGNNTVLHHFVNQYPQERILISAAEHPSVAQVLPHFKNLEVIPLNKDGMINEKALEQLCENAQGVSLISCMYASNETGTIQDINTLAQIAHQNGALFHCDATQAAGRIPVDMKKSGIDFLTLSSHKIGGPQGVGALALGLCGQTPTLILGGGQEKSARAGTENVAGIAGFGAAANAALNNLDEYQNLETLRSGLEQKLKNLSPDIVIHGENTPRTVNTSFFSLPGSNAQSLLMALDLDGIAISNGSACSSGSVKPSETLKAMGLNEKITTSALRLSMGWATKESDIDAFLTAWNKIQARIDKKR